MKKPLTFDFMDGLYLNIFSVFPNYSLNYVLPDSLKGLYWDIELNLSEDITIEVVAVLDRGINALEVASAD